ncbi:NAD(P)-dependent alcohol dehydrogenase [Parasphingorhabdus sp.]|uniref:NAD(P)-dependent alcohol dehydrogenase n=1 Tax=Parasphingorhabdus sp. TaxID=2709688 RepID=UPI0032647DBA
MTKAYASLKQAARLKPLEIERRAVGPNDVQIHIDYCGVCHSDIHMVNNDWGISEYPMVPGHEIVGHVVSVGSDVTKFQEGQRVGVGYFVDSCRTCEPCKAHMEQYCENGFKMTHGSETDDPGGLTFGGYSDAIIVDEGYVLNVPENLDMANAAPLLCAGITAYSPLRNWDVKRGDIVGVIGLGGLGHMGVKMAHAMGAHVVMITTSQGKAVDAKSLGADDVLISTDQAAMAAWAGKFDFLLNTIPVAHDIVPYMSLLKLDATMCLVGIVDELESVHTAPLLFGRRSVAGSLIGGTKEAQEMLDFCGEHNITADIELIKMNEINDAHKRMEKGDVKYRFVIDLKTI